MGNLPLASLRKEFRGSRAWGFWGWLGASQVVLVVKNPPANAGDMGSIPRLGRSPGRGPGNPPQYSCLEDLLDRAAWWATFHSVAKSQTQPKHLSTQA